MKLPKNFPTTREGAIDLLGQIKTVTINKRKIELDREAAVKAIDDRCQVELDQCNVQLTEWIGWLQTWSATFPEEFGASKSIESLHGRFGYRLCPPSLRPLKPLTWAKVVDTLKRLEGGEQFLRVKEEVDKQAILANREGLGEIGLRKIGVKVAQDEEFFVDPKMDTEN
jgi:phage host-nuclease inhibitor protein Gam